MGRKHSKILSLRKNKLYLIGAGDFGREMESWLGLIPEFFEEWSIEGYLDKNPEALNGFPSDYSVLGDPLDFLFNSEDFVLICLTSSKAKKIITDKLHGKVRFFTYVAPSAVIGKFNTIKEGAVIAPNCIISTNVVVEKFTTINFGTHIGHDSIVGAYSSIMANVDLGGHVKIGESTFIGSNSTIIPKRVIAPNIIIGAGAIVVRNLVKPGTYFGNPAVLLKE